jgi:hypothetical protein
MYRFVFSSFSPPPFLPLTFVGLSAQSYVMMHMSAVIGAAAVMLNWTHERTPESDDMLIIATIFPKDGCRLNFTARDRPVV